MSSNKDIEQNRKEQHDHTELGREILRAARKGVGDKQNVGAINLTALRNFVYSQRTEAKREVWDDIFARMSDGELEMTLSGKVAERLTPKLVELFPELKENQ